MDSTAKKITVAEIHEGRLQLDSDQYPYLESSEGNKNYRIRIAGIVLKREQRNSGAFFLIDDGTGTMILRCFDKVPGIEKIQEKSAFLCIGRVRSFHEEKYIAPELLKEIDQAWLSVYARQRSLSSKTMKKEELIMPNEDNHIPQQKIAYLITSLDTGSGVVLEELLEKSPLQQTEKIVREMLERGEIFEITPGRIKLL